MNKDTVLTTGQAVGPAFNTIVSYRNSREPAPLTDALPEILCISSYPPRECGIATYSQDLYKALQTQFENSFTLNICAMESGNVNHAYPDEVKYVLDTTDPLEYQALAEAVNKNGRIKAVIIQHEFGFFQDQASDALLQLLYGIIKPVIVVFHTVLPSPDDVLQTKVYQIVAACDSIVVMTKNASKILRDDYGVPAEKIVVIAHGTHLVPHLDKMVLKEKYGLTGRKVLSTFGLLSSGKGIETTLDALPAVIESHPDVVFLVIGKTHPGVVKTEGEQYRALLEAKVKALGLQDHVQFINRYLPLQDLLEYLQLTDIYLFTSKDPNQAVSGTFSYAMSCACPIISTPIPHAMEVLRKETGILFDFLNSQQMAEAVNRLLSDEPLRLNFSASTLQRIVPTAWENSAVAHALLIQKTVGKMNPAKDASPPVQHLESLAPNQKDIITLQFRLPDVKLDHLKKMTTEVGMIQFSIINTPDIQSGYTLDDNARALIAVTMHYELTGDAEDVLYITKYLDFIRFCMQPDGRFLNYVDSNRQFTKQNGDTNLSDANGRAIWALGYVISKIALLPADCITKAESILQKALPTLETVYSTRSMAFSIKGLFYYNLWKKSPDVTALLKTLADRLVQMYRHESDPSWLWYESYLTYANSILPEALLCAWQDTGELVYKETAKASFDFLLSHTFNEAGIKVISNKTWLHKGGVSTSHGEQPIDIAYTILALKRFHETFKEEGYSRKMNTAFSWFLGANHLHQIIYNPCTGGCYDGLEESQVNLNQGAESVVSYLMARLSMEKLER
jgi:glycosyltransferase involved in cell wall biosynthesis